MNLPCPYAGATIARSIVLVMKRTWWNKAGIDSTLAARSLWLETHQLPAISDKARIGGSTSVASSSYPTNARRGRLPHKPSPNEKTKSIDTPLAPSWPDPACPRCLGSPHRDDCAMGNPARPGLADRPRPQLFRNHAVCLLRLSAFLACDAGFSWGRRKAVTRMAPMNGAQVILTQKS